MAIIKTIKRIKPRGIFEKKEFLARVREVYLKLSEKLENVTIINAEKSFDEVVKDVEKVLEEKLNLDC